MLKRRLATVIIIAAFVGAVALVNVFEPERSSERRAEEAAQIEEQILAAEELEAKLAREAAALAIANGEEPPPTETKSGLKPGTVVFEVVTTKGAFEMHIHHPWAPIGAQRFLDALDAGVYADSRFFRVIPGYVVQFGIPGDPKVAEEWRNKNIPDEPGDKSNVRGTITFAKGSMPNSRSTQLFINLGDNAKLDDMGFAPIGHVTRGMDVLDAINAEYRERPDQPLIQTRGNAYLDEEFPNLDYITSVRVLAFELPEEAVPAESKELDIPEL